MSTNIASLAAALQDQADKNRQLRQDISRAVNLIDRGDIDQARSLLRRLSRTTGK
ncbi:hypothetical protein OIU91_04400 [Streptomyces sp. NBC_01456]|uniref:hypothetical protein n=1 Tax=unclassified Streptomyces TaxID=2593676 RepID=UPI002E32A265|nr:MULTISPECIES: hypothetical protein [unclassified Streptomyces]